MIGRHPMKTQIIDTNPEDERPLDKNLHDIQRVKPEAD